MTEASIVVVLGAAVWADEEPSPTLTRRTRFGIAAFQAGGFTHLLLSGAVGKFPPSEAEVMARMARAAGVPDSKIVLDETSRTTFDTARFVWQWRQDNRQMSRIVAVTDAYHAPRTWLAFRAFGLACETPFVPPGKATSRRRLLWSFLREGLAIPYYLVRFAGVRVSSRAGAKR